MMMKQRGQAVLIYISSSVLIRLTFPLRAMELHARGARVPPSRLCLVLHGEIVTISHSPASSHVSDNLNKAAVPSSIAAFPTVRPTSAVHIYINFKRRWTT